MKTERIVIHNQIGLVGLGLILSTLACSTQGLGVVPPTPTLFVFPTMPPIDPTATTFAEEMAGQDATPAASSNPVEPVDVCALYTKEDLEALYGEPITGGDGSGTVSMGDITSYFCVYYTQTSPYFQITVTPTESIDAAVKKYQETKMIFGVAQSISGLGDEALFDPAMMGGGSSLAARQGTFVASVDINFDENAEDDSSQQMDEEARLQLAQSIMQTILSRLPQTAVPGGGSAETQALPTESPASAGELDPCALYTQTEIEELFGEQAALRANQPAPDDSGTIVYTCSYSTVAGYWVTIGVSVYDSADAATSGYQHYNSMYTLTPISGIGDEAGYVAEMNMLVTGSGVFARQGIMLVNVWVTEGANDLGVLAPALDPGIRSQRAQDITKVVISRLPK